jgi:hypothetical protein
MKLDRKKTEELLTRFCQHLEAHGYMDDDWRMEWPSPVKLFIDIEVDDED